MQVRLIAAPARGCFWLVRGRSAAKCDARDSIPPPTLLDSIDVRRAGAISAGQPWSNKGNPAVRIMLCKVHEQLHVEQLR